MGINEELAKAGLSPLTCEVCNKEPAVGVAAVPGVPLSVGYGSDCLAANAHPYWVLVANTALCDDYDHTIEEWRGMVDDTLAHLEITRDKFDADVEQAAADIAAEERRMAEEATAPAPRDSDDQA